MPQPTPVVRWRGALVLTAFALCSMVPGAEGVVAPTVLIWTNAVNVTQSAGAVRRESAVPEHMRFTAGVTSSNSLEGVTFTADGLPDLTAGLTLLGRTGFHPHLVDWGIELRPSGFAWAVERGAVKKLIGPYQSGDTFAVIRNELSVTRMYHNDVLRYESPVRWSSSLVQFMVMVYSADAGITNAHYAPDDPLPFPTDCLDFFSCPPDFI